MEKVNLPTPFLRTALAIPDQIEGLVEKIDTVDHATTEAARLKEMADFAERIKADGQVVNSIIYGSLRCKAKVGELMPRDSKRGRGKKSPVSGAGLFNTHTLAAYRKLNDNIGRLREYFEEKQRELQEDPDAETMTQFGFLSWVGGAHVGHNSGQSEWYTPEEFIVSARKVLGTIDLDPASCDEAQRVVKATEYYTVEDDGLSKDWRGRVFMNPPYNPKVVADFVEKLCEHVDRKDVRAAILLVNNATETTWFVRAIRSACAVNFPTSRINFLDKNGNPTGAPLQGQAFVYFGNAAKKFCKEFGQHGWSAIL